MSRGAEPGLCGNASLYYVVPAQLMAEGKMGEWISAKERHGLRLHSVQFFRTGIDRGTIPYHQEIRLAQGGPILVLGFKER